MIKSNETETIRGLKSLLGSRRTLSRTLPICCSLSGYFPAAFDRMKLVLHRDRADSVLIAEYGRRSNGNA